MYFEQTWVSPQFYLKKIAFTLSEEKHRPQTYFKGGSTTSLDTVAQTRLVLIYAM